MMKKIRTILIANGITSHIDQNAIVKNVQRKNVGLPVSEGAQVLTKLPVSEIPKYHAVLLNTDIQLSLKVGLRDGQFIPRTGSFLSENISDAVRIQQTKPTTKRSKLVLTACKQI